MITRRPWRGRWQAALAALLGGLLLVLAGCGRGEIAGATRAGATPTSMPSPVAQHVPWPDDGATDHPIASTGCGLASPVAPGVSAQQSVAVNPAADEAAHSEG